jgi:hypothetical protein
VLVDVRLAGVVVAAVGLAGSGLDGHAVPD